MSLSVVIPNFNHGASLAHAVLTSVTQSPPPCEVLVVDDASTDDSARVLSELVAAHPAVRVVRHPRNLGPCAALNTGIAAAKGDWLLLRAADDASTPGSFAAVADAIEAFPEAGLITGDVAYFEHSSAIGVREPLGRARQRVHVTADTFVERFGGNILHGSATFVRRTWALREGGLDERLRWHSDWFLFVALALRHGFVYTPQTCGAMRLDARSYNSRGTADPAQQADVLAALMARLRADPELLDRMIAVGCLDFFGEPLRRRIHSLPAGDRERFAAVLAPPPQEVLAAREETGISAVLREFLLDAAPRIREHAGSTAVFGAGGHTRALLLMWRAMALPDPVLVLDSRGEGEMVERIRVASVGTARALPRPLIVLSSKSYEPLLAETVERDLPGVPYLKIWGRRG